jgi:hypothetical protein
MNETLIQCFKLHPFLHIHMIIGNIYWQKYIVGGHVFLNILKKWQTYIKYYKDELNKCIVF